MSASNNATPAPKRSYLSFGRMFAIAQNTFREALRHRVFVGLGLVGAALLLFSAVLGELATSGQLRRVLLNFGLFALSLFGVIAGISLGAVLLHKEMDRKTVYTLLSKPVPRHEFLLGKFGGLLGVVWVGLLGLALVWFLVLQMQGVGIGGQVGLAIVLIAFEAMVVAAVTVMFSAMSSAVVTAILSIGVVFVGRLVDVVREMLLSTSDTAFFVKNPDGRWFGESLVAVWPDFSVFNVSQQVLLDVDIVGAYMVHTALYALGLSAFFLAVGIFAISRRDFV